MVEKVNENENKYRGKSIEYWRNNASEDYVSTPISVLKYIAVLEDLTTEVTRLREALEEGELKLKSIKGELILHDLFQIAAFKNEDGMPVIKYVDKPNGGSVAYIRHDSMVKKINSFTQALTPTK